MKRQRAAALAEAVRDGFVSHGSGAYVVRSLYYQHCIAHMQVFVACVIHERYGNIWVDTDTTLTANYERCTSSQRHFTEAETEAMYALWRRYATSRQPRASGGYNTMVMTGIPREAVHECAAEIVKLLGIAHIEA